MVRNHVICFRLREHPRLCWAREGTLHSRSPRTQSVGQLHRPLTNGRPQIQGVQLQDLPWHDQDRCQRPAVGCSIVVPCQGEVWKHQNTPTRVEEGPQRSKHPSTWEGHQIRATPIHKNTFLNIQYPPSNSAMFQSEQVTNHIQVGPIHRGTKCQNPIPERGTRSVSYRLPEETRKNTITSGVSFQKNWGQLPGQYRKGRKQTKNKRTCHVLVWVEGTYKKWLAMIWEFMNWSSIITLKIILWTFLRLLLQYYLLRFITCVWIYFCYLLRIDFVLSKYVELFLNKYL